MNGLCLQFMIHKTESNDYCWMSWNSNFGLEDLRFWKFCQIYIYIFFFFWLMQIWCNKILLSDLCVCSCVCACARTHAQSCATLCDPMDYSLLAPLSMEISREEYQSGLPFPTLGDPPDPGIEPASLGSPALAGRFFTTVPPGEPSIGFRGSHYEKF